MLLTRSIAAVFAVAVLALGAGCADSWRIPAVTGPARIALITGG